MPEPLDDTHCPLCGEANACGIHDTAPCWCMTANIPQALLELVPEAARQKACICQQCVAKFQATQPG